MSFNLINTTGFKIVQIILTIHYIFIGHIGNFQNNGEYISLIQFMVLICLRLQNK